jgi:hypothetical protein
MLLENAIKKCYQKSLPKSVIENLLSEIATKNH